MENSRWELKNLSCFWFLITPASPPPPTHHFGLKIEIPLQSVELNSTVTDWRQRSRPLLHHALNTSICRKGMRSHLLLSVLLAPSPTGDLFFFLSLVCSTNNSCGRHFVLYTFPLVSCSETKKVRWYVWMHNLDFGLNRSNLACFSSHFKDI